LNGIIHESYEGCEWNLNPKPIHFDRIEMESDSSPSCLASSYEIESNYFEFKNIFNL